MQAKRLLLDVVYHCPYSMMARSFFWVLSAGIGFGSCVVSESRFLASVVSVVCCVLLLSFRNLRMCSEKGFRFIEWVRIPLVKGVAVVAESIARVKGQCQRDGEPPATANC